MIHIIIMISIRQFTHGFTVIKSGCFFNVSQGPELSPAVRQAAGSQPFDLCVSELLDSAPRRDRGDSRG